MSELIGNTIEFVKNQIQDFGPSHDWSHIERVWKNAKEIGKNENVDHRVVELAALLHDINDRKYFKGSEQEGRKRIQQFLSKQSLPEDQINQILDIIGNLSFSAEGKITCLEQMVVQDADRLDAIGAVGIARCIAYATEKGNPIHIPGVLGERSSISDYRENGSSSAISHFYDKLLLIKDKMLTKTGKRIAQKRHNFLVLYLEQFLNESKGLR